MLSRLETFGSKRSVQPPLLRFVKTVANDTVLAAAFKYLLDVRALIEPCGDRAIEAMSAVM